MPRKKDFSMYRCLRFIKPEEQARLRMIEEMAYNREPAYHACIGISKGHEILAMVHGIRKYCNSNKVHAVGRLWCFHWGRGFLSIRKIMHDLDERYARNIEEGKIKRSRRLPLENVVNWSETKKDRTQWENVVRQLSFGGVEDAPDQFGLIHHCGVGHAPEILSDFDTMLPMMGPETMLMINSLSRAEPQKAFRRLQNSGWDGLELNNMGILQRRSAPKEV